MNERSIDLPQPQELSEREKEDAMGAYFMMFAAWGLGLPLPVLNLGAAVIYFFLNRKSSLFVAFHSLQSLLSQIPVTLVNVGAVAWLLRILFGSFVFPPSFFVYLVFAGLVNILYIVFSVVALVRARRGQFYYMPLFGRLSFARYYGRPAAESARRLPPNRPPEGF